MEDERGTARVSGIGVGRLNRTGAIPLASTQGQLDGRMRTTEKKDESGLSS